MALGRRLPWNRRVAFRSGQRPGRISSSSPELAYVSPDASGSAKSYHAMQSARADRPVHGGPHLPRIGQFHGDDCVPDGKRAQHRENVS